MHGIIYVYYAYRWCRKVGTECLKVAVVGAVDSPERHVHGESIASSSLAC
jgi:hypothetical protein